MNIISINRKIKAILIRLRIHRWLGFIENIFLNASYMIRLSRWVDTNRQILIYDDFYNAQPKHGERFQLYKQILDTYTLNEENIAYLEFGVASGTSMRWWTDHNIAPSSNFWGFDTFEGLPERYGSLKQGVFNMKGQFPEISDERIKFVKGLFQDTLLENIKFINFSDRVILHIDSDLFTAALYVLTTLLPYLKKGDLILFDEFGVPGHEFRAFVDFVDSFYLKLKPIGAINNYLQVIFEITEINSNRIK